MNVHPTHPTHPAHPIVRCRRKLAANASADPLDVLKTKSVLQSLGHYDAPEWGVSPYPDAALFDAIKAFQKSQGLKTDGVIDPDGETEAALSSMLTPRRATTALQATAQALQAMGRGGDELLAHITPEEAVLLDRITDGASVNPDTGLLEFYFDASADHKDNQSSSDQAGSHADNGGQSARFDPSMDHKQNQGTLSPKDDGPTADNGGREGRGRGQGQEGNTDGLGAHSSNENDAKASTQTKSTSRRASAKEDTLNDSGGFSVGFFETKEENKEDNPPGYDPDETIEDVEQQIKAIMKASKKKAEEEAEKKRQEQMIWNPPRFYGPEPKPTPSGGPRRPNNRPKSKQHPEEEDKTRDPNRHERRAMRSLSLAIAKELLKYGITRINPVGLVDTEVLRDAIEKPYGINDDPA